MGSMKGSTKSVYFIKTGVLRGPDNVGGLGVSRVPVSPMVHRMTLSVQGVPLVPSRWRGRLTIAAEVAFAVGAFVALALGHLL